ncbi:MAG: DUF695 domain-containing protein [Muribaculaceae bacterium]|nr:DUF695 domain-containing protein [Muribaculaceae bacterium]
MARVKSDWWTTPTESDNGRPIMVTGRRDMEPYIESGKYTVRIEVTWPYDGDNSGMPDLATSKLMGDATDAIVNAFDRDPIAIVTGIYTGDNERNIVLYCRNTRVFESIFNKALEPFPLLPISLYLEDDPEWNEYREMRDLTEIADEE